MSYNDPEDIRLAAGKALDATLVTQGGATGGKSADLVTVVKFNDDATLLYPLGDPAGGSSVIDSVGHSGGTFIGYVTICHFILIIQEPSSWALQMSSNILTSLQQWY
jgi:hypothetical protein